MFKNDIAIGSENKIVPSMPIHAGVASQYKVTAHRQRIVDYLAGESIYPVTLELDLTSQCNRSCQDCPSTRAAEADFLDLKFVEKLFRRLAGQTPGLLLTGGEPSMAPLFPAALKMARENKFQDIAVVTNGSRLDEEEVYSPLLEYASTIRLSLYDFENASCEGIENSLLRIERLRRLIDSSGSDLKIGISTLTSSQRIPVMKKIAAAVCSAGAHWLYFHPMCLNWGKGAPYMIDQGGVVDEIHSLQQTYPRSIDIYYAPERYRFEEIVFDGYHGAHFLMNVGADGKNYLGAEVKYQPSFAMADFNNGLDGDFLWQSDRLANIAGIQSSTYPAIQSRHRGALYSDLLDKMKNGGSISDQINRANLAFRFPAVL